MESDWPPHPVVFSLEFRAHILAEAAETKVEFSWFDTGEVSALSQPVQGVPPIAQWEVSDDDSAKVFKQQFNMQSTLGLALGLQEAKFEVSFVSTTEPGMRYGSSFLRLCPLLMTTSVQTSRFYCCRPGLLQFQISVLTDVDLLSEEMLNDLQPLWIRLKAVKNLPNDAWLPKETKGIVATCYPAVSQSTESLRTHLLPSTTELVGHDIRAKFQGHDIVYFLGLTGAPHRVRDWLVNDSLAVEVHDREKINVSTEEGQSEPKFPHGICYFKLADLLKPHVLSVELRSDVCPIRGNAKIRYKELRQTGLSCETLLEKETREKIAKIAGTGERREFAPEYLYSGCFCQITATRKCPLLPAREIQTIEEALVSDALAKKETLAKGNIYQSEDEAGTKVYRFKVPKPEAEKGKGSRMLTEEDDESPPGPWRYSFEDAEKDEEKADGFRFDATERRYEKFSRIVVIIDVKNAKVCKTILDCVLESNLEAAKMTGLPNCVKLLQNRILTEEEQADLGFDYLSGFIIMDSEVRIIVIEGLREGKSWQNLLHLLPCEKANERKYKIFYHDDIGFPNRLYGAFHLQLKQIKLRQTLQVLTRKPILYDLTTTDEGIYRCLTKLRDMTRARRLQFAKSTFPTAQDITTIDILYGDYMSDQELLGGFGDDLTKKKGSIRQEENLFEAETIKGVKVAKILKPSLDMTNDEYEQHLTLRESGSAPNIQIRNKLQVKERSKENAEIAEMMGKVKPDLSFLEGKEVYMYSMQKNNSTGLQKAYMRSQMELHKNYRMWSYSLIYNTCSFELEEENIGRPTCTLRGEDRSLELDEPWRLPKARPKVEYRKPTRDVTLYRSSELEEAWVENEWHRLPFCEERRKPLAKTQVFDSEKIPHLRQHTQRPFDVNMICKNQGSGDFGPVTLYKSVHIADEGPDPKTLNIKERIVSDTEEKKRMGPRILKFHDLRSREQVTDLDRTENILKDEPARKGLQFAERKYVPMRLRKKYGTASAPCLVTFPSTMRTTESWNEAAPEIEFETRMRGNDDTAPYNVKTGCYVPRHGISDLGTFPTLRTKRSFAVGELKASPWRHTAQSVRQPEDAGYETRYMSNKDFDRYKKPPKSFSREDFVKKNATRAAQLDKIGPKWQHPYEVKRQQEC